MDHLRIKKVEYNADKRLISHLEKFKKYHPGKRVVLLKHHTYVNFTLFDNDQPTFINVVRHPVGQFASFYYFQRYGWGLSKGDSFNDAKNVRKIIFAQNCCYRNNILNRCMGTCNKSTCSERLCTDPSILGNLQLPVAGGHLQHPPAAATTSNINHLQLFLQLAAATCSNIKYLQPQLAAQKSLQKIHKSLNNNN